MEGSVDSPPRQAGVSLIMVLLMLSLIALLGIAGMRVATMEERMAWNAQDRAMAFQAAETALRECESLVRDNPAALNFDNSEGLYSPPVPGMESPLWLSVDWSDGDAVREIAADSVPAELAEVPRCIIESLPGPQSQGNDSLAAGRPVTADTQYRITARAVGVNSSTVVMLQTHYRAD